MTDISYERRALRNVHGSPPMRLRSQWGARRSYSSNRTVTHPGTRVFIHISVTNPGNYNSNDAHARAIESIGASRFPNTGISYNRGIMHSGAIYEFQPVTRRGAHTVNDHRRGTCNRFGTQCPGHGNSLTAPSWNLNYNARSYVICQNVGDSVTDAMIDSLARQIVADYKAGFITRAAAHNFHGHRCVSSKSCPGDRMWARMYDLHTSIHHYLDNGLDGDMPITDADAKKIAEAVWKTDGIVPKPVSNTDESNPHWWASSHLHRITDAVMYHLSPEVEKTTDLLEALADRELGADSEAIKAHIDEKHVEAKARQDAISAKLDEVRNTQAQLVDLVEAFDASEMTAEEVAEALKSMVHAATSPNEDDEDESGN